MPSYKEKSFFNFTFSKESSQPRYWLKAQSEVYSIYIQFKPSNEMLSANNIPEVFIENEEGEKVSNRSHNASKLEKAQLM